MHGSATARHGAPVRGVPWRRSCRQSTGRPYPFFFFSVRISFQLIFFKQVLGYAPPIREAACAICLEEFRERSLCVRFSFPSLFDFLDWTVFITGSDKVWTRVPQSLHQPLVDAARKLPCLSVRLCCAVLLISGFCPASLNLVFLQGVGSCSDEMLAWWGACLNFHTCRVFDVAVFNACHCRR